MNRSLTSATSGDADQVADLDKAPSHVAERALQRALTGVDVPTLTWAGYDALVTAVEQAMAPVPTVRYFEHRDAAPPIGRATPVRLAYFDTAGPGDPLICIGGLANTLRRFDYIAYGLDGQARVIALDLAGRGHSGWLSEQSDYRLETYIRHLETLIDHLGLDSISLLGSSLGGAIALSYAAAHPHRVKRIILNDVGPFIPRERRQRRASAVARHYVFRRPADLFRRVGAAEKNAGPVEDAVLLHNVHSMTRWSDEEDGRVYKHDLRAMLAYRQEARDALDLWREWDQITRPVLFVHGLESDAVLPEMLDRMRRHRHFSLIRVPQTGHTPTLSDPNLIAGIGRWIGSDAPFAEDLVCPPIPLRPRNLFNGNG